MIVQNKLNKTQYVIPRWLNYKDSLLTFELSSEFQPIEFLDNSFESKFEDWKFEQNPHIAVDLFETAVKINSPKQVELAKAIVSNPHIRQPAKSLPLEILRSEKRYAEGLSYREQIQILRHHLREFPRNPIKWVDLARLYTIVGEDRKAQECFRVALNLAPNDRFVLRAYARFCIHESDPFPAYKFLTSDSSNLRDPWILASAASLSQIGRLPSPLPKVRTLRTKFSSSAQLFHNSELLESSGMSELQEGKDSSAKKLFKSAWIEPSQNVITHSEWVTSKIFPGLRSLSEERFSESPAAAAHDSFLEGNFLQAIDHCRRWRLEEPFSTQPFIAETSILSLIENFHEVLSVCQNADSLNMQSPVLDLNHLFSAICLKDFQTASLLFSKLKSVQDPYLVIPVNANKGLMALAQGNLTLGKQIYADTEKQAKILNQSYSDMVFSYKCLGMARFGYSFNDKEAKKLIDLESKHIEEITFQVVIQKAREYSDSIILKAD